MSTAIAATSTFRKRTDARYRNIGGEGIVVRQAAGEVLVLSDVGARVLDLVQEGRSVGEILAMLGAEYDTEPATLEADITAYLAELVDAGVIE